MPSEKEMLFTWYSKQLAEIESDARLIASYSRWRYKAEAQHFAKGISQNCVNVRNILHELLIAPESND